MLIINIKFILIHVRLGFIKKILASQAIQDRIVKMIIGVGSLNSASIGAKIVAVRANVLQIPKVVAVICAGNSSEFER